ncbi:hypothetical protein AB9E06_22035 [Rhizobium leguminosarum]|uniref:hypothetical protein n=1 Tax=Rhizobium leguminosarum TaxID=384 RepID=UPI003F945253
MAIRLQPTLSLAHDSQSGNGSLDAGWKVIGLSVITRGPKSKYFDSVTDGICLQEADAFHMDGQRLIPVSASGRGPQRVINCPKEIDDQTQILETGADFGSSNFFARTKGGMHVKNSSTLPQAASDVFDTTGDVIRLPTDS